MSCVASNKSQFTRERLPEHCGCKMVSVGEGETGSDLSRRRADLGKLANYGLLLFQGREGNRKARDLLRVDIHHSDRTSRCVEDVFATDVAINYGRHILRNRSLLVHTNADE